MQFGSGARRMKFKRQRCSLPIGGPLANHRLDAYGFRSSSRAPGPSSAVMFGKGGGQESWGSEEYGVRSSNSSSARTVVVAACTMMVARNSSVRTVVSMVL